MTAFNLYKQVNRLLIQRNQCSWICLCYRDTSPYKVAESSLIRSTYLDVNNLKLYFQFDGIELSNLATKK